jgi:S1-C subfamily serine protease
VPPRDREAPVAPPWTNDWRPIAVALPVRRRPSGAPPWLLATICIAATLVTLALGVRWWAGAVHATGAGQGATLSAAGAALVTSSVDPTLVDITARLAYPADTEAEGTGIVLSADGLVLTNNHVISGAESIRAFDVGTGQQFAATVVGYDHSHDVALLQLQGAADLPAARLGDSSKVKVGDPVVGIGNAGGRGGTPTAATGTLVALDERIESANVYDNTSERLDHMIATDADIEPGDSGGPLVDRSGRVIGIDTAGSRGSTGFLMRRGFAIPIDAALAEVRLIEAGRSSDTLHVGQTAFLGVEVGREHQAGLAVTAVLAGTPAAQAGLAAGDVIVSLDGRTLDSPEALSAVLCRHVPGDAVQMVWDDESGAQHSSGILFASGPPA